MNSILTNAFTDELEKTASVESLLAALGGALVGGEAGHQISKRLLKGKGSIPLQIAGSLGVSMVAGGAVRKVQRKRAIRRHLERLEKTAKGRSAVSRGYRKARLGIHKYLANVSGKRKDAYRKRVYDDDVRHHANLIKLKKQGVSFEERKALSQRHRRRYHQQVKRSARLRGSHNRAQKGTLTAAAAAVGVPAVGATYLLTRKKKTKGQVKIAKEYKVRGGSGRRARKGAAEGVRFVLGRNVSMNKLRQYRKSSSLNVGGDEGWADTPITIIPG